MKLKLSAAVLAIAAVMSLTACTPQQVDLQIKNTVDISFSWWGKDLRHNYTISALKDFTKQNPEIDVATEYSEFESFQERMSIIFAAHNECDVMQINYDWLFKFSPEGNGFYDMEELSKYIDFSNFSEEQLSYGRINGKLNGISNALNTETCYYNQKLYEEYGLELPACFDDLFKSAEVMSVDGVYPTELSKKASWLLSVAYEEQVSGKKCFDEKGTAGFTKENFGDLLAFYKRLVDEKVTKYYPDINRYDFQNEVSAGTVCWISDAGYYCQPLINSGMSIVVGEYLRQPGSSLSGWYAKPTSLYCIRRDTKNPEAAAKLVNFLVNSQEMAELQGVEKGIPLSKAMLEVLESNDLLKGIQYKANEKIVSSNAIERISPYLESADIMSVFEDAVKSILLEDGNIDEWAEKLYSAALDIKQ